MLGWRVVLVLCLLCLCFGTGCRQQKAGEPRFEVEETYEDAGDRVDKYIRGQEEDGEKPSRAAGEFTADEPTYTPDKGVRFKMRLF